MNEGRIKSIVLMHVRRAVGRCKKPVVTAEFTLGSSGIRADLAILGDEFVGIEIKGETDTLRRLPSQMKGYDAYFDRTILVVANRHLKNVDRDQLHGAALWSFDIMGNLVEKSPGRPGASKDAAAYLDMMTLDDRNRARLQKRKQENFDQAGPLLLTSMEARAVFEKVYRRRYEATSVAFWRETARRQITPDDLPLLSRFSEQRNQWRQMAEQRDAFWQQWAAEHQAIATTA